MDGSWHTETFGKDVVLDFKCRLFIIVTLEHVIFKLSFLRLLRFGFSYINWSLLSFLLELTLTSLQQQLCYLTVSHWNRFFVSSGGIILLVNNRIRIIVVSVINLNILLSANFILLNYIWPYFIIIYGDCIRGLHSLCTCQVDGGSGCVCLVHCLELSEQLLLNWSVLISWATHMSGVFGSQFSLGGLTVQTSVLRVGAILQNIVQTILPLSQLGWFSFGVTWDDIWGGCDLRLDLRWSTQATGSFKRCASICVADILLRFCQLCRVAHVLVNKLSLLLNASRLSVSLAYFLIGLSHCFSYKSMLNF